MKKFRVGDYVKLLFKGSPITGRIVYVSNSKLHEDFYNVIRDDCRAIVSAREHELESMAAPEKEYFVESHHLIEITEIERPNYIRVKQIS